ncbi:myo-inosose-2 dehydratase [Candidatus Pantoea multigeneris]|uniref:Myo-inosose-2 dehydratase n=1 Tax=Candidatus Pantoea multigeneris TaxID=2608357 RepID=A0ABX0RBJ1_9GAMM|nr:myo-inosose-2 dehydratase [Pantoea multigeneris]NIF21671.1 myo-inosose-2 dehydratase [Pantoea multigeneris]
MNKTIKAPRLSVKVAISPLSWANEVIEEFGKDATADICLTGAQAAGYEGVEMSRLFPRNPDELNLLLSGYHLSLASGWHSGFLAERSVDEELSAVHEFATLLQKTGSQVMVYGECAAMADNALDVPMSRRRRLNPEQMAAYGARLTKFASKLAQRYGLALAYHHHLMMVVETQDEIRQLMAATGDEVGLLLDTGHALTGGFSYVDLITEFGPRIKHIHLKDVRTPILDTVRSNDLSFNEAVRAGMFSIPGDGAIDFLPLVEFINDSGYAGWVVVEAEQDPSLERPEITVARARDWLSTVLPGRA